MKFNDHFELIDKHAFLSASKYHWINYSDDKLVDTYTKYQAIQRGTDLHNLASQCINLKVKLPKSKSAINMFVNDAIGYRMVSEQPLYYSTNAFGTADAVSFRDNSLRIHDLKTGISRVSMAQLEIYTALFCLEYDINPEEINIELRIYQGDEIIAHEPDASTIKTIMDKIVRFDMHIEKLKQELE